MPLLIRNISGRKTKLPQSPAHVSLRKTAASPPTYVEIVIVESDCVASLGGERCRRRARQILRRKLVMKTPRAMGDGKKAGRYPHLSDAFPTALAPPKR
jgi:hypothetical protein